MSINIVAGWLMIAVGMALLLGFFAYALWLKIKHKDSVSSLLGLASCFGVLAALGFATIIANGNLDMSTIAGDASVKLLVIVTVCGLAFGAAAAYFLHQGAKRVLANRTI